MTPAEFVRASRTAQGLPALIEDDAAIERAVAIVRPAVAMPSPVPFVAPPTASVGTLAGDGIGAAGAVFGEVGEPRRSASEQGDGAGQTPDAIEERAACSAQKAG